MGKSPNTFSIRIEKRTTDNKTKSNRSPSSSFFRLCISIRLFRSGMYSANVHHGTARSLDEIPVDLWAALSHSTAELGVHKNFDIFPRELADHPLFIEKCVNCLPSFKIN
jgi:hypothetical protein